jgi:hypothetical protein
LTNGHSKLPAKKLGNGTKAEAHGGDKYQNQQHQNGIHHHYNNSNAGNNSIANKQEASDTAPSNLPPQTEHSIPPRPPKTLHRHQPSYDSALFPMGLVTGEYCINDDNNAIATPLKASTPLKKHQQNQQQQIASNSNNVNNNNNIRPVQH